MKHIRPVSMVRRADALTNYYNAIFRAWVNYWADKKDDLGK